MPKPLDLTVPGSRIPHAKECDVVPVPETAVDLIGPDTGPPEPVGVSEALIDDLEDLHAGSVLYYRKKARKLRDLL
jgi:hypothetical protein